MKTKSRSKKRRFSWKSFKDLGFQVLHQKIGKWVAWDNMGLIRSKDPLQMYAPGLIKKVSKRGRVTIWVPSMITAGGARHTVSPSELFPDPGLNR